MCEGQNTEGRRAHYSGPQSESKQIAVPRAREGLWKGHIHIVQTFCQILGMKGDEKAVLTAATAVDGEGNSSRTIKETGAY